MYGLPALLRKAVIIGKMQAMGNSEFGSLDESFNTALNAYATRPGADGYVRYYYADALSNQSGEVPTARIREILAPLYSDREVYKNSSVGSFLKNERKNVLKVRRNIVKLAKIDPKFHDMLLTYGWKESDF